VQAICDRVAILSEGNLVKFGTVPELVGPSQEFEIFARNLSAAALQNATQKGYVFQSGSVGSDDTNGAAEKLAGSTRFRAASSEELDGVLNFIRDSGGQTIDVKGHSETLEDVFIRSVRSDGR